MFQARWPRNHSCNWTTVQPRMRKLARVLPTRMVHKNRSGFSRKPCSSFAEGLPARASCRTRSRFKANTPASMPDNKNEAPRHTTKTSQLIRFGFIYFSR